MLSFLLELANKCVSFPNSLHTVGLDYQSHAWLISCSWLMVKAKMYMCLFSCEFINRITITDCFIRVFSHDVLGH